MKNFPIRISTKVTKGYFQKNATAGTKNYLIKIRWGRTVCAPTV